MANSVGTEWAVAIEMNIKCRRYAGKYRPCRLKCRRIAAPSNLCQIRALAEASISANNRDISVNLGGGTMAGLVSALVVIA